MIEFFETMQFWHWIILAIVLILLKVIRFLKLDSNLCYN